MRLPRRAAAAIALALLAPTAMAGALSRTQAAGRGANYLESRMPVLMADLPADTVSEALGALLAGGVSGGAVDRSLAHIRTSGPPRADEKPAYAARIAMALVAAGADPRSFGGFDYVERIRRGYDATTGAYDSNLYANALAVLGLLAADEPIPERALTYLRANQCPDGGFSWREGCLGPPDTDTTAVVTSIFVRIGTEGSDPAIARARLFLQRTQDGSGGFPAEPGKPANANSTGLVLSLLAALGEDPSAAPWVRSDGADPVSSLQSLQTSSGGFRYVAGDSEVNDYATIQAIPGLAGHALPLGPPTRTGDAAAARGAGGTAAGPNGRGVAETSSAERSLATAQEVDERSRAGVVVRSGDGDIRRMCVFFDEPEITGEELLVLSGLDVEFDHTQFGAAVCRIGPDGCAATDCFCETRTDETTFWGYWNRDPGEAWTKAEVGPSDRAVRDGAVDGWSWGPDGDPEPPDESLDEICAAAPPQDTSASPVDDRAGPDDEQPAVARGGLIAFGALVAVLAAAAALLAIRRRRAGS